MLEFGDVVRTVAALNSVGTGIATNSVTVTAPAGPTIAITAPANNAAVSNASPIDITVTASVAPNTISKIEIFDGATLLGSFTPPAVPAFTLTYGWAGAAVGSHVLTAKVTDSQAVVTTSAATTVQVLAGPAIALSSLSNYALTGSAIDLNTTVTVGGTATIARVEFFANNGTSNTLIGTVAAAPYNFRWPNVAAGSYSFTAKVTDSQTLATTSAAVSVTVGSSVTIQFATGLNGSSVNDDAIPVSGTLSAPPNSAVNINGQFATVTSGGQFFLNELNLQPGANTVTATLTTADGQTATQTITVNRSGSAPQFVVTSGPGGIATATSPLRVDVKIENPGGTAFATITLQCNDPVVGATLMAIGTYQCVFAAAGIYTVKVTVKDNMGGVIYSVVKVVTLKSPEEHIAGVRGTYSKLLDRLAAGNVSGTATIFTEAAQAKYAAIFGKLAPSLTTYLSQIGQIGAITAADDHAEIVVIRTTGGVSKAYSIYLLLGGDGIWRIESM